MSRFTPSHVVNEPRIHISKRALIAVIILTLIIICSLSLFVLRSVQVPSEEFPTNVPITIPAGSSAKDVAEQFANAGYVKSAWTLYLSLVWWYDPTDIKASTYVFPQALSPQAIAREVTMGHFVHDLISLTIKEGERATTIAARALDVLPEFDANQFLALAIPHEGKLFPDTYFVPSSYSADELFSLLTQTYYERVTVPLFSGTTTPNNLDENSVIILASILEREANSPESMRLVAGILLNRLEIGMALQVDASMEYVLDKPLQALTPADLDIDSPYNTYLYPGLPPTPIGNPGLTAINAILSPTPSEFYYYITGTDGNFYYAKTYSEHRANIDRHLR